MTADSDLAMLVLRAASQLIAGIQEGVAQRGYHDVRPAHGFAFIRIAAGDATVVDIAGHLGITKQAASQLVEQLVARGYVARERDPADGRARRLLLTEQGRACTRAAEAAGADAVARWRGPLGAHRLAGLAASLEAVAAHGPLRPAW